MTATRNIVLFGECGVGKSSIINAIVGRPVARTSSDIVGCTDENASYSFTPESGVNINLWDTIGLDEGTAGKIPADEAKLRLKQFLQRQIASPQSIDLLLYCVRGASGRRALPVKRGHWENYKFVFDEICKKKVPIAMIVTCLESYNPGGDMDAWWDHNERRISEFNFQLCAHACVTILTPELFGIDDDVNRIELSRCRLRGLLSSNFLPPRNVLLLGDREDRDDFVNMVAPSRNNHDPNHKVEGTPSFTCIPIAFGVHTHANLWNMSGFDETDDDALMTEKNLKLIVQGIKKTAGIDLLVFCFRAGRVRIRHIRNHRLFHAAICRKKVPMTIIILGPEEESDTWWQRNEKELRQRGLHSDEHVYVPCDPCQFPVGELDDTARRRLIQVMQEEYTSGSWQIGDDAFWVTVLNVRAVVGELSWPTTTVVVCDTTRQGVFVDTVSGVQTSLRGAAIGPRREHRFQQVDPRSLSLSVNQSSGNIHPPSRISDQGNKGISLIMFFMPAEGSDGEQWKTLETFHSVYKGDITPFIVVVCGVLGRKPAEDFWLKNAPRHIRRWIGAYLTYHPGPDAGREAKDVAQETMVDMIRDRCLVDLGERVGILQEILSVWRKYRSQRDRVPERAAN